MQKTIIIGNIGKDAEAVEIKGHKALKFPLAEQARKDSPTTWWSVVFFTDSDTFGQYLKKGAKVYVEGNASASAYEKNGSVHASLNIFARELQIVSFADKQEAQQGAQQEEEDLPL